MGFLKIHKPIHPTEKSLSLTKQFLIKKNSSIENSIVMDCFSGSGTTLEASFNLKENYCVDNSIEAINV